MPAAASLRILSMALKRSDALLRVDLPQQFVDKGVCGSMKQRKPSG
jgi:hypothetical protein